IRMLATINLHHEVRVTAGEIRKVRSYRQLPDELETIEPSTAQFVPKFFFRIVLDLTQLLGLRYFRFISSTHCAAPHPPFGHLLPVNGEKEDQFHSPFFFNSSISRAARSR